MYNLTFYVLVTKKFKIECFEVDKGLTDAPCPVVGNKIVFEGLMYKKLQKALNKESCENTYVVKDVTHVINEGITNINVVLTVSSRI